MNNRYYSHAVENVPCECPGCFCPYSKETYPNSERVGNKAPYSFVLVNNEKKYWHLSIGKSASTTARMLFFGTNHKDVPPENTDDYFKFTFVRNPWDRLVSNWKMFTTVPFRIEQLRTMTNSNLTKFEDFVEFAKDHPNHHWCPQVDYFPEPIDFVGRVEHATRDLKFIGEKIGVPVNALKKQNESSNKTSYVEYYTSEKLINIVADMYAKDISQFQYGFK